MKEKINYPLEIMKDRKELIDKEISTNGNLSMNSYNLLLKQIGVDIYDSINNLKEWNSFTIKGSLYVRSTLGIFIPRKRELRKMILLGLDSGKVAFDNYKRVLEGLDITNDTRSLSDLKILIEQLYNAEVYTDNYDDYMNNLMVRNLTNYLEGDYNYNYLIEMEERRDKVLELEKKYLLVTVQIEHDKNQVELLSSIYFYA